MLSVSLNKTISFFLSLLPCTQCQCNCCYIQIYRFTLQEIQHFVDVYGDHQSLTEGSVEGIRHLCALLASESTALSSLVQQGRGMTSGYPTLFSHFYDCCLFVSYVCFVGFWWFLFICFLLECRGNKYKHKRNDEII